MSMTKTCDACWREDNGPDEDSELCSTHAAAHELLVALKGVTRILEAFSYTTQLGKSQRERLDAAKAAIAKAESA